MEYPATATDRLILRPFTFADTPDVHRLMGEWDVASTTLLIPHSYGYWMAEEWTDARTGQFESGEQVNFAITLASNGTLLGGITLSIN